MDEPFDDIRTDAKPLHRLWVVPPLLVVAGALALTVDLPVSRFLHAGRLPGLVDQLVECGEVFGHAIGVLFILVTVAVLDPRRRPVLARIAACSWGAGLVADLVKMGIARTRPHRFDLSTTDVLATFDRWLPLWTSGHGDRSFPSAHTATAFGLAIGLAAILPRGRKLFLVFASLCALQRVQSGAHYLSDVCVGAAVGWTWAACCLDGTWIARAFDGFESKRSTLSSATHASSEESRSSSPGKAA